MTLTDRMQNCTFRVDYGWFTARVPWAKHGLRKRPDCFMVRLAPVMHPGEANHPPSRLWPGGSDGP